jgi:5'(3')-deoxyribonucleotidase
MPERPVLALDVDECLFPFLEYYAHWLPTVGQPTFTLDQMQGFGVSSLLGMEPDEGKLFEMRFLCEASLDVPPMDGSVEAVTTLSQHFELHAVTARIEDLAGDATRAWLHRWFPDVFTGAHLLWATLDSDHTPKGEICTRINAAALVDDSPSNLASLAGTDTSGVLLGQWPWTQSLTGDWFHALDWPTAVDHLVTRHSSQ